MVQEPTSIPDFSFCSSVAADTWNGPKKGSAYEWWYFDALSDDSEDAVVIIFLDNFVFSPRYNKGCANTNPGLLPEPIPAVAFTYYSKGKPVYRIIAEYQSDQFIASTGLPAATIGSSGFEFKKAPYGSGYLINIDLPLKGTKRLTGKFEWLTVESDLAEDDQPKKNGHFWNLVAPRCDVTGSISITSNAKNQVVKKFRGTGYHDHNSDSRWLPDVVDKWFWGRAHFPFATAVFYHFRDTDKNVPMSRLFLIREGRIDVLDSDLSYDLGPRRDKFGLRYPGKMVFRGNDIEMEVQNQTVIDSSFFYLRFITQMQIRAGDEEASTTGIAEYLKPVRLKNRWFNRLVDFRISKNDKPSFLK